MEVQRRWRTVRRYDSWQGGSRGGKRSRQRSVSRLFSLFLVPSWHHHHHHPHLLLHQQLQERLSAPFAEDESDAGSQLMQDEDRQLIQCECDFRLWGTSDSAQVYCLQSIFQLIDFIINFRALSGFHSEQEQSPVVSK